jgi:putative transposase
VLEATRTYVARITNHQQGRDDLDQCGVSASKLWNVGRYYIQQRWDKDGEIPDEAELNSELKAHERYSDLHSQSSQRVLDELAEAFTSWYNSDDGNNPLDTGNVATTTRAPPPRGRNESSSTTTNTANFASRKASS